MTDTFTLPADDLSRALAVAAPDDPGSRHIALAGGIYTFLVTGEQTQGRYCLIDMLVPNGGGPPPHRHDFEEMFTLLEGELEFTFRGETRKVAAPSTVNIPSNAPHSFRNTSGSTVHLLCMCAPAGQDEFFAAVGTPVLDRNSPPPPITAQAQAAQRELAGKLAPRFATEMIRP